MRIQFRRVTSLLWLVTASQAQVFSSALSSIPSCALSCLTQDIPSTGCNASDPVCLCGHKQLWTNLTTCARSQCTTHETLIAQNISKSACDVPFRDQSRTLIITSPLLLGIATFFAVVRVSVRSVNKFDLWGWDDSVFVLTLLTGAPVAVLHILLVRNGIGKDIWTVPFSQIDKMLFYFFLAEPFYLFSTVLMKISILAFYLRIFTLDPFRTLVRWVVGVLSAFALGFLFASIFQCSPISYIWTQWDNQSRGQCLAVNEGAWAHAVLNILLDLTVLILPLPQLARLQLSYSWKSKLQIGLMFSTGIIVTLISALRLRSLVMFANTTNQTWDYFAAALWSAAEVYVGIVCACLPAARVFVVKYLLRWFRARNRSMVLEIGAHRYVKSQRLPHRMLWGSKSLSAGGERGQIEVTTAEFIQLESRDGRRADFR